MSSFFVVVLLSSVPPKIYDYKNVTATEGDSATLVCFSEGDPSPDMTFRKTTLDYDYVVGENVSDNGAMSCDNVTCEIVV